jgi:hypothetical protein
VTNAHIHDTEREPLTPAAADDSSLLASLVNDLSVVPGLCAIALGGSRARGTATAQSDDDVGLYPRGLLLSHGGLPSVRRCTH